MSGWMSIVGPHLPALQVVLPLLGARNRMTADIDVAGPDDAAMDQVVVLLEIARDLGLPAESVNQAGAYFVRGIDGWRDALVVLHEGPSATMHVPNATLFVLTKMERLTEADLDDCVAMLRRARTRGEPCDRQRLRGAVDAALGETAPGPREKRLRSLRAAIGTSA